MQDIVRQSVALHVTAFVLGSYVPLASISSLFYNEIKKLGRKNPQVSKTSHNQLS
jgi:hypothetical protein